MTMTQQEEERDKLLARKEEIKQQYIKASQTETPKDDEKADEMYGQFLLAAEEYQEKYKDYVNLNIWE